MINFPLWYQREQLLKVQEILKQAFREAWHKPVDANKHLRQSSRDINLLRR